MKIVFTIIVLAALCFSFSKTKPFIPPGTVQINDTLFADETEVTNISWQEYEFWTKTVYGANSKEHIATLPDTACWKTIYKAFVQHYYRHPIYRDFPVVGVSYEQALAYCKWRTERVNTFLTVKKIFKHPDFHYRLPTKIEWEKLAETSSVFLGNNGKNEKGIYRLNFLHPDSTGDCLSPDNVDITSPAYAYWPNSLKIYNAIGNVAEMISEKGICKGGSWKHYLEECRIGKDIPYTQPTNYIGFRCVCIVKSNA